MDKLSILDLVIEDCIEEFNNSTTPIDMDGFEAFHNGEKMDIEEIKKYEEFRIKTNKIRKKKYGNVGRKRPNRCHVYLSDTEHQLFKDKVERENTTIQDTLLSFVRRYLLEE